MDAELEVRLAASGLAEGTTDNSMICPHCGVGGGSFSVTRTKHGALYNCFRAKCGKGGWITLSGTMVPREEEDTNKFIATPLRLKQTTLSDKLYEFLNHWYRITKTEADSNGLRYVPTLNSISMLMRTPMMEHVGHITKRLPALVGRKDKGNYPKSKIFKEMDYPKLYFPMQDMRRTGPIVIVEDMYSAIRAARHLRTAFIAGTSLSMEAALQLRGLTDELIVALDPDVWITPKNHRGKFTPAPTKMKNKYGGMFGSFKIAIPNRDIKDMRSEKDVLLTLGLE